MPTELLSSGVPTSVLQNTVYALPAGTSYIDSSLGLEVSNDGTSWASLSKSVSNKKFVRCTSGAAIILVRSLGIKGIQDYVAIEGADELPYQDQIVADGASYYWKLDDTSGLVARESIQGANGTISGGVTLNQAGAVGKSMSFDGASGQIQSSIITIPTISTIEFWIKPTSLTSYRAGFSCRPATNGFMIGNNGTSLICYGENCVPIEVPVVASLIENVWQHIVFVRNATSVIFYINGVAYPRAQTHGPVTTTIRISDVSSSNAWAGSIDEVAIYPYALSPAQIQSHYLAKNVPPYSYASAVMKSTPTNYWQMDEEGGLVANDLVGGKHGTISGGVTLGQAGIGKSMLFNGSTGRITIGNTVLSSIHTIEGWIKITGGTYNSLFETLSAGGDEIAVFLQSGQPTWRCVYSDASPTVHVTTGSFSLPLNSWHYVAFVCLGTSIKIYVNGSEVPSSVDTGVLKSPLTTNLPRGLASVNSGAFTLTGGLDEVAIYNRALTATEIQSHFLAKFGITDPSSYAAKVALSGASNYWPLNEVSGLVANDVIGNAAGTISGGVVLNGNDGMTFDGVDDKIVVAASVIIPLVCTFEAWLRFDDATQRPVLTLEPGQKEALYVSNRRITIFSNPNSNSSSLSLTANIWHHGVWVLTGTTVDFYNDGVFNRTQSHTRTVSETGTISIGHDSAFGAASPLGFFNGSLDKVAIYPRALTPAEILDHYNSRNS